MQNPQLSITGHGAQGGCLCIYCPINACGAVYWHDNKVWFLVMPVDPTFFISSLQANGFTTLEPAKFEAWRAEILSYAGTGNTPQWRWKN